MGFSEAGCVSIEACGEVKAWGRADTCGTDGGTYHDDSEFAFGRKEGGILCPLLCVKCFVKRTSMSPSITANDKPG